ncbi:hypothetical protein M406DRAFT_36423 [Cryphonectria parasitica EP155]|uniref:Amidohydrolase-related domain-containing protein n=1 Tax=Cryphonectria parasitica (strain ATCC 38755 / EP155) TaxID=660469 RepID=A0A9P4YCZ5_CRYP1|nr:uncharacterized protein M406DRAFT_36423 [Cryphonectria parasitica EP155]KAF3771088.1 hypothetical protein M406DRAFT_36423 [Cryphonectria parasitica EP155]
MASITRTITLEEHVAFPSLGSDSEFYEAMWKVFPKAREQLWDHGSNRLADMDANNVSFQIMSHIPGIGVSNIAGCRGANDEMAAAVQKNPKRLGGFAVLPMAHPKEAAEELERAVKHLGLLGALVDNHLEDGTHYDDEKFWPVFEAAERLDVPIYPHPTPQTQETVEKYYAGNYPPHVAIALSSGAWGWHENVGLHFLKLYSAGVFDRFPKLKLILGHMGEMVPYYLDRAIRLPLFKMKHVNRSLKEVWDENVWVTTSSMFSLNPLATLLRNTKIDRIMYSIDYPFEKMELGPRFLEELAGSGMVTPEELEMITHKNAERLLKL